MRSEEGCFALPMTFCKAFEINTDYFPHRCTTKKRVSSRGWRSAPRDLRPAQALARYEQYIQRIRRHGHLCDPIPARGPSSCVRQVLQIAVMILRWEFLVELAY